MRLVGVRAPYVGSLARSALGVGAAAVVLAGCGSQMRSGLLPTASSAQVSVSYSRTFKYNGRRQHFRVPPNVTSLTVVARGGAGAGTLGGRGGRIYAIVPVVPGETLEVVVGGEGSGQIGGFNGGANGGDGTRCRKNCDGDGGGGASDVREDGNRLANRILIAGGGGGQGGPFVYGYYAGTAGGKGGGSTGGTGAGAGSSGGCAGYGGSGGTQSSGGVGGKGGDCIGYRGGAGADGIFRSGGVGGQGLTAYLGSGPGGGGGGGGYYGGGGAGAGTSYTSIGGSGGGGGGGSSYIEPKATKFQSWQGWKNATTNGLVVFSWN